MPCNSVPYAVARVKVLESKMINKDQLNRMIEAVSAESAFKTLIDAGYGGAGAEKPWEFEKMIASEMNDVRALVSSITPNEALSDVFIMKYDYQNAKAFLKMRMTSMDVQDAVSGAGKLDEEELKEMVYEQDTVGLPDHLAKAIDETEQKLAVNPNPQVADLSMDKAYMQWALDVSKTEKNAFVRDYFMARVDLSNILAMLRVRFMDADMELLKVSLLDGGTIPTDVILDAYSLSDEVIPQKFSKTKYGKHLTTAIEQALAEKKTWRYQKYMDNYLVDLTKDQKDRIFSLEPVIGYFLGKESEARAIRMVMTGKLNNLPEDVIRERVRELYV